MVKGKAEKRTEQESEKRRREIANLFELPKPAESLQTGADFSGKI